MQHRMHVKELPRRIDGMSVVKGAFLGWLSDLRQKGGYFCYALTYAMTEDERGFEYQGHLMWAERLDTPWRRIESTLNMTRDEALAAFTEREKLADWPEGI